MAQLGDLYATIRERQGHDPAESWTAKLLSGGREACARKFGEEAIETMIAGLTGSRTDLIHESADMIYHLMVLLAASGCEWKDVERELARRRGRSGIEEKRSR